MFLKYYVGPEIEYDAESFGYAFRMAYTDSDDTFRYKNAIKSILYTFQPKFRKFIMNSVDRKMYKALPDRVTIYRGMTIRELESDDFGVSWTLDEKTAIFFKDYYRNYSTSHLPKTVHSIEIWEEDIMALFVDGLEGEVIYFH